MAGFTVRFGISFTVASLVSLALFYLMQYMISGDGQPIEKPENYQVVDFVRLVREPEDKKSLTLKRIPLQEPVFPPSSQSSAMMKIPQGQPPEIAKFSEPVSALTETMQWAKPAPLFKFLSKRGHPDNPPAVARASSGESEIPESAHLASQQEHLSSEAATPHGTAQGLLDEAGNNDVEAMPVFKIEPRYPRRAAKKQIEGWVKIEFTITEKGTVSNAVVVDSRPRRIFDRSAIQSIRKWRFRPKLIDGRPVQRKARQIIKFKLAKG